MLVGSINQSLLLELVLTDGNSTRFPRVTVYNSGGALVATVDLTNTTDGLYQGSYTPTTLGHFSALYTVYSDAGHTTVAPQYDRVADHIFIQAEDLPAVSATVAAGSTSSEIRTTLTQANGFFDRMVVRVKNAAGTAVRIIEEYTNLNGALHVSPPLPFTPSTGDPVTILAEFVPQVEGGIS